MKTFIKFIASFVVLIAAGTTAYLLFTGPRMFVQPNIREYQAVMPSIPHGSVPVSGAFEPLGEKEKVGKLTNPLPSTPENIAQGKTYYGYYCVFCHGDNGDGFGPVGFSYVPVPADLRTQKTQSLSDGLLLYAMLTGTGHDPVLQRIVLPQYRWYLVLYIRQFNPAAPH